MRLQNDGQAELTFVVGARSLAHGLASDTCRLSSLDLRLNYIADEGATELYRVLTLRNRSLTTLNVSSNLCTGMSTGALAKMLRHNDCVTRLDVSSNNLAVSHKGSTKFSVENCFPCPSPGHSGVVIGGHGKQLPPPCRKIVRKMFFLSETFCGTENCCAEMHNLRLKMPVFGKFRGKIGILSIVISPLSDFATVCQNFDGNFECLWENFYLLSVA